MGSNANSPLSDQVLEQSTQQLHTRLAKGVKKMVCVRACVSACDGPLLAYAFAIRRFPYNYLGL